MGNEKNNPVQLTFIEILKKIAPPNISLVDELADLLEVSNDSAYRRLRGETSLSIDEAVKLCDHFKLPLAVLSSSQAGSVNFNYQPLNDQVMSFKQYFDGILNDLKAINNAEQGKLIYAAEDIPIFHHFRYPELTAFKMFYWNKSIMNVAELENKKFDPNWMGDDLIAMAKEVFDAYAAMDSIELWTDHTVNSTLKQIEYFWDSGFFQSKEDALHICDQVKQEMEVIKHQAELSAKYTSEEKMYVHEDNFVMYNSDLMLGTNCLLAKVDDMRKSFISYHTFNVMSTTDKAFCADTEKWLDILVKKSLQISGVAEKQRNQFFRVVNERIDNTIAKIS